MRHRIKSALSRALLAGVVGLMAAPAQAEIIKTSDNGFITRDEIVVDADLTQTWLALISPADWWLSAHTWSGDASNLRLLPQAGGCFCEKIPEVDEPGRFTLEGSVEHMRVVQAYPENALRMVGALGPLQSEPVAGVLTIALTQVETPDGMATRIVWEYNVGGSMRYEVPVISKAVDGVMSLQLAALGKKLGKVELPDEPEPEPEPEAKAGAKPKAEPKPDAARDPEASDNPAPPADSPKAREVSVDEAFDDLAEPDETLPAAPPA